MTDERPDPSRVPDEWAPPSAEPPSRSSLAPPPPPRSSLAPPPAAPVGPEVLATGPIAATPRPRPRWLGRTLAAVMAGALVVGGGVLALNAGTADGGADSPQAALQGALDSLSAEDLLGAAEFVEPSERETMIDAGIDVVEELVRLEVFSTDLDLSALDGFDFEFEDLEIDAVEIRPGLAHVFLEGGRATAAVDGSEVPLGSLITDRVDAETLNVVESDTSTINRSENPVVAVERGGRWYLSLWYSVAENARLAAGEPVPDPAARPVPVGGSSPEDAVDRMVAAATAFDLEGLLTLLDPQEAAALYDYAPLFLDDGQAEADRTLDELRRDGWNWDVTSLTLRTEGGGDVATVHVDAMRMEVTGPDVSLDAELDGRTFRFVVEENGETTEMVSDGDCTTITVDDQFGGSEERFCLSEMVEDVAPLQALSTGLLSPLQSVDTPGLVVRNVDGRWYVSPLRTGAAATLASLRAIEPEALAEAVDALVEWAEDPFAYGIDPFDTADPFDSNDLFEFDSGFDSGDTDDMEFESPEFEAPEFEPIPEPTEFNVDLLAPGLDPDFVVDLDGPYRDNAWFWTPTFDNPAFDRGVQAGFWLDGDVYADLTVLTGIPFDSDEAILDWLGGEIADVDGLIHVRGTTEWGTSFWVARTDGGLAFVTVYAEDAGDGPFALLAQQMAEG